MIKYFYADSLKAYFECIREIEEVVIGRKNVSGNYFSVEKPPILWYRAIPCYTFAYAKFISWKREWEGDRKIFHLHMRKR